MYPWNCSQGAPNDISDMRDRFEDIERDMKKRAQQQGTDDKLDSMEKDLDHLMGRGETSDISGVPTMVQQKILLTLRWFAIL